MTQPGLNELANTGGDTAPPPDTGQPGRIAKLGAALMDRVSPNPGEAADAGVLATSESYDATRLAQGGPTNTAPSELPGGAIERAFRVSDDLDRIEARSGPGFSPRPEEAITVTKTVAPTRTDTPLAIKGSQTPFTNPASHDNPGLRYKL